LLVIYVFLLFIVGNERWTCGRRRCGKCYGTVQAIASRQPNVNSATTTTHFWGRFGKKIIVYRNVVDNKNLLKFLRFCAIELDFSHTGRALCRCNRCSCTGPRASGGPAPWCLGRLFILPDTPCAGEFTINAM